MLLDCHNHTNHSFDGKASVEEMCLLAQSQGFLVYCITDHYECQTAKQQNALPEIIRCGEDIRAFAKKHPGSTRFLYGVELGQPLQDREAVKELRGACGDRLDFIIGSLHNAENELDFYEVFTDEGYLARGISGLEELCCRYYEELLAMCREGGFDSVGHILYPYRYAVRHNVKLDYTRQDERVRAMMREIIEKGIALEINTSGYRQGFGGPLPGAYHLAMYRELGGELITIGSDAHRTGDFAKNISDGLELIKAAGFRYITYFEKRKPVMVKL